MRVAIALLFDHSIHNFMRQLAVDFHQRFQTGFLGALLPPHISLKQPFQISDLEEISGFFDELAGSIEPLKITLTRLELQTVLYKGKEYGLLWLAVKENQILSKLHNRINRELSERFENTGAPFDGAEYRFHATVAIGGQSPEIYREFYDACTLKEIQFSYTARELSMFYYDDNGEPGTYITYRTQPIGRGKQFSDIVVRID